VVRKNENPSLSSLVHEPVFIMMQATTTDLFTTWYRCRLPKTAHSRINILCDTCPDVKTERLPVGFNLPAAGNLLKRSAELVDSEPETSGTRRGIGLVHAAKNRCGDTAGICRSSWISSSDASWKWRKSNPENGFDSNRHHGKGAYATAPEGASHSGSVLNMFMSQTLSRRVHTGACKRSKFLNLLDST
jgi:hypothetical protein